MGGGGVGGSSPPAYQVGAVAFDGATYLSAVSLGAPADNEFFSYSFWVYVPVAINYMQIFMINAAGNYNLDMGINTNAAFLLNDFETFAPPNFDDTNKLVNIGTGPTIGDWLNYVGSCKTNAAQGGKSIKSYCNSADVTGTILDLGPSFVNIVNGLPFFIGTNLSDFLNGYLAEVWIAPTQSLLTAGDISPTSLAKFRDPITGKPVDLGTDGSLPTGTAPAIYLHQPHGNTDPTQFAVNRGTGGTFDITGALTIAPSSPSD